MEFRVCTQPTHEILRVGCEGQVRRVDGVLRVKLKLPVLREAMAGKDEFFGWSAALHQMVAQPFISLSTKPAFLTPRERYNNNLRYPKIVFLIKTVFYLFINKKRDFIFYFIRLGEGFAQLLKMAKILSGQSVLSSFWCSLIEVRNSWGLV